MYAKQENPYLFFVFLIFNHFDNFARTFQGL